MSRITPWLLVFQLFILSAKAHAGTIFDDTTYTCDTILPESSIRIMFAGKQEIFDSAFSDSSHTSKFRTKKRIAAILAFPFPFGLLGLHRVFLGTKPYIPFVYMGTVGGCFLILPIIDFITILSANEEEFKKFENNPRVFMWSH